MNDTLQCLIAKTTDTRQLVYRLRHDCYSRKGSIAPRPDGEFHDRYDKTPNNFSFLVKNAADAPVATVRISVVRPDLEWTESPAREVFGDHPAFQTIADRSFVEASRLCFGDQARRDAFIGLVGHMAALAEYYDVEWLMACPRIEHTGIYQRLFGFRPLAAPRRYFGVNFETQLLGIRRSEIAEYVCHNRSMMNAWASALEKLRAVSPTSAVAAGA